MAEDAPRFSRNELYRLIREDDIDAFNKRRRQGDRCDMRGLDFRGQDLRRLEVDGIDFSNCYFRQADLRGLNMSSCRLEGASIRGARISGTLFPGELSAGEIRLSLEHGTRMRYGV